MNYRVYKVLIIWCNNAHEIVEILGYDNAISAIINFRKAKLGEMIVPLFSHAKDAFHEN